MRDLKRAGTFKDDFKRQMSGPNKAVIEENLPGIIELWQTDQKLPEELIDHPLERAALNMNHQDLARSDERSEDPGGAG